MDFHGRLSPPEDSTKSPQWEQAHAELMFTLVWTFSIFLNSSKTLTADHASSNFAITQLATGTSPQLSAKDAVPEEHKNISTCPPPLRHSSGRNTKQSNFTSRGNNEGHSPAPHNQIPFGRPSSGVSHGWGCSLPAIPPQHRSTISHTQGLLPNPLRGLYPGRSSLAGLQSTHKDQISTEMKSSQHHLFQADFLVKP